MPTFLDDSYADMLFAELTQKKEFQETGRWHVDCPCDQCSAIYRWHQMSWWQKRKAKKAFFKRHPHLK